MKYKIGDKFRSDGIHVLKFEIINCEESISDDKDDHYEVKDLEGGLEFWTKESYLNKYWIKTN